jgi:hypothetical protein
MGIEKTVMLSSLKTGIASTRGSVLKSGISVPLRPRVFLSTRHRIEYGRDRDIHPTDEPKYIEAHGSKKMQKAFWTDNLHHSGPAICERHEKAWTKGGNEKVISNQENAQWIMKHTWHAA